VGLKTNGTHLLPAYSNDVNLLGEYRHTIKKNTGNVIEARKEDGLEIKVEKTKYISWPYSSGG
jgi:hypothetical protein